MGILAPLSELLLAQAVLQTLPPSNDRLVDGFGRGGKAPLQSSESEPYDRAASSFPYGAQALRAVHLLANVVGYFGVEDHLRVGQLVLHAVSAALGEEGCAVELEQLLLDQAAHHVRGVHRVKTVSCLSLEPVGIEEAHEQLEVDLLSAMGRGSHEEKMAGDGAKELSQAVPLGDLEL